jgi:hypothetical protein
VKGGIIEIVAIVFAGVLAWQLPLGSSNWWITAVVYLAIGLLAGWLALHLVSLTVANVPSTKTRDADKV